MAPDDAKTQRMYADPESPEGRALAAVLDALRPLSHEARVRVVAYMAGWFRLELPMLAIGAVAALGDLRARERAPEGGDAG